MEPELELLTFSLSTRTRTIRERRWLLLEAWDTPCLDRRIHLPPAMVILQRLEATHPRPTPVILDTQDMPHLLEPQ
jgi:hypothetical protein